MTSLQPFILLALSCICAPLLGQSYYVGSNGENGNSRIHEGKVDIGEDEFHYAAGIKELSKPGQSIDLKTFPNPASDHIWLEINLPHSSLVHLRCYNSVGQEVFKQALGYQMEGYQQWKVDISPLPTGVFHLLLNWESGQVSSGIWIQ